jgi:hypothetical protein
MKNKPVVLLEKDYKDLISNKKASGRHRDLDDVESLEKILKNDTKMT